MNRYNSKGGMIKVMVELMACPIFRPIILFPVKAVAAMLPRLPISNPKSNSPIYKRNLVANFPLLEFSMMYFMVVDFLQK